MHFSRTNAITSTVSQVLPYPPEQVWAVVTDLESWQWRSDLRWLEHTGDQAFTEYGPNGYPTHFKVTGRQPPVFWSFDLENTNLTGCWRGAFQPVSGGTCVTFTESVTPKKAWMRLLVKPYLRRQQSRYLADLRQALAAGSSRQEI